MQHLWSWKATSWVFKATGSANTSWSRHFNNSYYNKDRWLLKQQVQVQHAGSTRSIDSTSRAMGQVCTANSDNNHQSNKATCFQGSLPTDSVPVLRPCQAEDFPYRLEPKSKKVRDMDLQSQCPSCGTSYGTGKVCTGGLLIQFIRLGILLRNGLL